MKLSRVHPCHLLVCLLWLLSSRHGEAAEMDVEVKAPPGWIAKPPGKEGKYPTAAFKAPGDRDAVLVIEQIAEHGLREGVSLEDFHAQWFKEMYGAEPDHDNRATFKSDHGEFWVSVFMDPSTAGKPVVRGDYKYVVQIIGLIDKKYIVCCGVLVQEKQGKDLDEAKAAVSLLRAK